MRKVAPVHCIVKVLSFFSSRFEAQQDQNLPPIQAEIARCPQAGLLTDTWIVLQFCRYERPGLKRRVLEQGMPHIFIRGMQLRGGGSAPEVIGEATVVPPGGMQEEDRSCRATRPITDRRRPEPLAILRDIDTIVWRSGAW